MENTIKKKYSQFQEAWQLVPQREFGAFFIQQELRYVHPFQICGNVYYVGDSWVCSHLIDTGDGLLLIDCGNCGATAMLVQAIWEAGFNPANVKWIILSHGHFDHIGGAMFFRRMFGTKIYMSAPDCAMFRDHPEQALLQESPDLADQIFTVDEEICDGDVLHFGNTEIECKLVPGHTLGCVALFFNIINSGETLRAGYYGGFGFNTLSDDYLTEIGDTGFRMRETYLRSLDKVRNEKVDVFLGNHTFNNRTLEKRAAMLESPTAPNPFIDPTEWPAYLDSMRDELLAKYPSSHTSE